ncbi:hypothetical protein TUM17569_00480 [Klebsiella oxytoca]|nr:hypothetical protein TUM17568_32660 [Klebsiella oxytoca]GJK94587.1 hypothetical protein TUM17569_00480 [Klebsiella oxytoca]
MKKGASGGCSPDKAQRRLRGILPLCKLLPGAALNAPCPGYGLTAVCGPVARIRRSGAAIRDKQQKNYSIPLVRR